MPPVRLLHAACGHSGSTLMSACLLGVLVVIAGCFHPLGSVPDEPLVDGDGEPLGGSLRLVEVASGLDRPTFVTHAGDQPGLFILEQPGMVRFWDEEGLRDEPVLDIRERVGTRNFEQGLLGMAFAPGFPEDDRVFLSYSDTSGDSVVSSFRPVAGVDPLRLDPGSESVVLQVEQPYGNHNGGMIAFAPNGLLFVGLGDGGSGGDPLGHGQDRNTLLGALLRLDVSMDDGFGVPEDNPFVGDEGAADEVWAYGLRNPWRFSFDRATGDLWIADVGQNRWEEVNHVPAGEGAGWNFGWNRYEGHEQYSDTSAQDPVFPVAVYPIRGHGHCAVTGGYVYRGESIPALEGVYVFGDWCSGSVWGLQQDVQGEWVMGELLQTGMRPSSFGEDRAGELYLVDHEGAVLRFEKKP